MDVFICRIKNYLVNVAVIAATFPGLNTMGISPLLYNANPLIFVKVIVKITIIYINLC
jgi:hypothetical protein